MTQHKRERTQSLPRRAGAFRIPGGVEVGPRRRRGLRQFFRHVSTDTPRMTPKPAWIVAILQRPWKPDARCGWLPAARAARTMVEGLIWLFSLASGRIPPVDCA